MDTKPTGVQIAQSFQIKPGKSRNERLSQKLDFRKELKTQKTLSNSHSSNDMAAMDEKSQWETMKTTLLTKDTNDDFFCIPKNTQNENDFLSKSKSKSISRRKSEGPISPPKKVSDDSSNALPVDSEQISFESISDFSKQSNEEDVLMESNEIMIKLRRELDVYLQQLSAKCEESNNYIFDPLKMSRKFFMIQKLLFHFEIKTLRSHQNVLQSNIRKIAELQDYIRMSNPKPFINFIKFKNTFISDSEKIYKAIDNLKRFKKYSDTIPQSPDHIDWIDEFLSIEQKSGRIVQRVQAHFGEMNYDDILFILKALSSEKYPSKQINDLLFDLAWQQYMFPFVEVNEMTFPDIFNYTPKIFEPPYLPESVMNTPFNCLNSSNWPCKEVSEDLFYLLVETDPFVIASRFWTILSKLSEIINQLAVNMGINPDEAEIGFEVLFKYLLCIVFAFGVSEILEVMTFSAEFYDFIDDNSEQQYAMTHFLGLVKYITTMDVNELTKNTQS